MADISQVMVVRGNVELVEGVRCAFGRSGASVRSVSPGHLAQEAVEADQLLVASGDDSGLLGDVLEEIRGLDGVRQTMPILVVGSRCDREEALGKGATEVIRWPVFLRDLVTVARMMSAPHPSEPRVWVGNIAAHFGLFYVVRAVASLGGRRVLTLARGLRRAEVRFFDGEVTSAQVGGLHGQAALHQLFLWRTGRFELREGFVVRRRQIPLSSFEIFAEAERFLSDSAAALGELEMDGVYVRDDTAARFLVKTAPEDVREVLSLFDGTRLLADALEDSPYRTFETLRVTERLLALGVIERTMDVNDAISFTVPARRERELSEERKKELEESRWDDVLPVHDDVDAELFSQVVPAAEAAGEFSAAIPTEPVHENTRRMRRPLVASDALDEAMVFDESEESDGVPSKNAAFSDTEETFFRGGSEPKAQLSSESFEDLDDGYELPRTFWGRFFRDPRLPLKRKDDDD